MCKAVAESRVYEVCVEIIERNCVVDLELHVVGEAKGLVEAPGPRGGRVRGVSDGDLMSFTWMPAAAETASRKARASVMLGSLNWAGDM